MAQMKEDMAVQEAVDFLVAEAKISIIIFQYSGNDLYHLCI